MKIVTYEEMVELPVGSVFCKYEPCVLAARWMIKTGETFATEMTTVDTRSYNVGEKGDLFAVLEDYEIVGMIGALLWALKKHKNDFKETFNGQQPPTDSVKKKGLKYVL